MNIKCLLCSICMCFLAGRLSAQNEIKIKGTLIDSITLKPVSDVLISIYKDDSLITQTNSEQNGMFTMSLKTRTIPVTIKFTHLNYFSKAFKINSIAKIADLGQINMNQKAVMLREVNISLNTAVSLKKKGDTLEADMSGQTFKRYVMTEKALERVPGVTIVDSRFFFNGEEITDIQVDQKSFIFDDKFLMKNLPGFTINKVQIIEKTDNAGRTQRSLNIVLKNDAKKAYLFNSILSKGTASSKWNSFIGARIDSLYQIGIRTQLNNINQFSDAWDLESAIRSANLQGLHQTSNIELSGLYKPQKKTTLSFQFLNNLQTSGTEQNTSIIDLLSKGQTQILLNNSTLNRNNSSSLKFLIKNHPDSVTTYSISSNITSLNNSVENTSSYITKKTISSDSINFSSNKFFKGNEASVVINLDKIQKQSKKDLYAFETRIGSKNGENNDYYKNGIKDSIANRKVKNDYLTLNYRLDLNVSKESVLQVYTNNDISHFTSNDTGNYLSHTNVLNLQNVFGSNYIINSEHEMFSMDLSILNYYLKVKSNAPYHMKGVVSNIAYNRTFSSKDKITINFTSNYTLPTITEITGISSFGEQSLLNITPNNNLKPEGNFQLNIKYNFLKTLTFDIQASYIKNKIDNALSANSNEAPLLKYFNSQGTKGGITTLSYNKSFLKNKFFVISSLGSRYSEANYLSDQTLISNNIVSFSFNLSANCEINKHFKLEYRNQLTNTLYINNLYGRNSILSNDITANYNYNDIFNIIGKAQLSKSKNSSDLNNSSEIVTIIINKTFLKNRSLTGFLKANNILDSKIGQILSTDADRIQYTTSNSIGRYFLIGITFKTSTFK